MYDDAEWLRFGIDPQRRAAFQTFVTEKCEKIEDPDFRHDCEMEMWAKLLMLCAENPGYSDWTLKSAMVHACIDFWRKERRYERYFPMEPLPLQAD